MTRTVRMYFSYNLNVDVGSMKENEGNRAAHRDRYKVRKEDIINCSQASSSPLINHSYGH